MLIFLGDVPVDASQTHSGAPVPPLSVPVMVPASHVRTTPQLNCHEQADVVEGFVPLNNAIAKRSGLSSFEPDVVIPYHASPLAHRGGTVTSLFCSVFYSPWSTWLDSHPCGSLCCDSVNPATWGYLADSCWLLVSRSITPTSPSRLGGVCRAQA